MIPVECSFGVFGNTDPSLIEVADLILRLGAAVSSGFLVPVGGHLGVLGHAVSGEVVPGEQNLIENRTLFCVRANGGDVCASAEVRASRSPSARRAPRRRCGS